MHQIGSGVLGPVFRTRDPDGDRLIAVKAFTVDFTPEQAELFVGALKRVVDVGLDPPSIVAAIDAGIEDGVPFLAQEYVTAESLDVAMRFYAPAPPEQMLTFVRGLAAAVDAAHARGVVHGALHLRDVFVTADAARVNGFGVAIALEHVGRRVPVRRPYTAPEMMAGRRWGPEADRFAVATIAYELLTGKRAAGPGDDVLAPLADAHVADPAGLQQAFRNALAADPALRPASAARFAFALGEALGVGGDEMAPPMAAADSNAGAASATIGTRRHDLAPDRSSPDDPEAGTDRADAPAGDASLQAPAGEPAAAPDLSALTVADAIAIYEAGSADEDDDADEPESSPPATEPADSGGSFPAIGPDATVAGGGTIPGPGVAPDNADDDDRVGRLATVPVDDSGGDAVLAAPEIPPPPSRTSVRAMLPVVMAMAIGVLVAYMVSVGLGTTGDDGGARAPAVDVEPGPPPDRPAAPAASVERAWSEQRIDTVPPDPPEIPEPAGAARRSAAAPVLPAPPAARAEFEDLVPPAATSSPVPPGAGPEAVGWLLVRTEPPGATVRVDGQDRGEAPLSLADMPFGTYRLEVSAPGHLPEARDVTISAETSVTAVRVELLRAAGADGPPATRSAEAAPGSVYIDSRPSGASVFVDGARAGVTPLLLPAVPAGPHQVRIEGDGYRPWSTTVNVTALQRARVAASLEPGTRR